MTITTTDTAPRRRVPTWLWVLLGAGVLSMFMLLCIVGVLSDLSGGVPLHLVFDGTRVWSFDPSTLSTGDQFLVGAGVLVALAATVIVVPIVLLIVLAATVFGLLVGVALPLMMVLLVVALVLSPALLLLALGVWLWRRSTARRVPGAANIAG